MRIYERTRQFSLEQIEVKYETRGTAGTACYQTILNIATNWSGEDRGRGNVLIFRYNTNQHQFELNLCSPSANSSKSTSYQENKFHDTSLPVIASCSHLIFRHLCYCYQETDKRTEILLIIKN